MPGVLFNLIYLVLIAAISPALLYQRWRHGKYREGWDQKLWGRLPERKSVTTKRVWIHAVSVGEVLQLQQLIRQLRNNSRDPLDILVTTTTQTGFQVAREKLADCEISYFPLDFTWSVREALKRARPDLVLLVELEIWPNFLTRASSLQIPVMLINGRLSEKSFKGYRKIRFLMSRLLNRVGKIAVQSEEYRQRFLELGCAEQRILVTGSIKFDGVETNRQRPEVEELRRFFQIQRDEFVFIAGSTQDPEEEMALITLEELRRQNPKSRLIIVPRHPERGEAIAQLIQDRGHTVIRRSQQSAQKPSSNEPPPVGLLDTVGELSHCWALADSAFVGGSFGNRGGQNMLEPAAYGVPVCCGPNTRNFRQIVEILKSENALRIAQNQDDLNNFVCESFHDSGFATAMGHRARDLVLSHQGATQTTVHLILEKLGEERRVNRAA